MLASCSTPKQTPEQRYKAAQELFNQTTKLYHLPSAQASGAERVKLLEEAARGYEQLLNRYPDQPFWCAQALRSLGNVRADQGRLDDAIQCYRNVASKYPGQDWEVVQAWKSAADLLWEDGRRDEALEFYRKIVERFDTPNASQVIQTIVRGAKAKLAQENKK
ncbi:MAG: tetratricopeptide repeat protein [Candidatus Omnitrophica bacterium]|nr:tetratricopeptide repeat protein [Candidatus Omnitrophota bacterium]